MVSPQHSFCHLEFVLIFSSKANNIFLIFTHVDTVFLGTQYFFSHTFVLLSLFHVFQSPAFFRYVGNVL